jgi:type II secretory pathway predicted ATPase ExeA
LALLPRTPNANIPPPAPLPKYLVGRYTGEGRSIKLKTLLLRHNLTIAEASRCVTQANGKRISRSAMSQLCTYGIVPAQTPLDTIKAQLESWLATHGVPASEIAVAFEVEAAVVNLHGHATEHNALRQQTAEKLRAAGVDEDLIATTVAAMVPPRVRSPIERARSEAAQARRNPFPSAPPSLIDPLENVMLTTEAKKHFGLARDPFKDDPRSADELFVGRDQAQVRDAMRSCVLDNGFVAIVGESGSGKTVLRVDLLNWIASYHEPVIVISPGIIDKTKLDASGLGMAIIKDLSPSTTVPQKLEAQQRCFDKLLKDSTAAGNHHIIIIEEAHDLTMSMLKQLKRFHEMRSGFRKMLGILLLGQTEMNGMLDETLNWGAREVIRRIQKTELLPLHGNSLQAYIECRLKATACDFGRMFDDTAIDGIRRRLTRIDENKRAESQLFPLVVNNLITRAANEAAALGVPRINADIIKSLGAR